LADAVDNELLAANTVEKVKRPRASTPEATSLTPDQVASLLRGAAGLRYTAVLRLILGTGRRGEALALRWADVDLDRGEARITGSPAGTTVIWSWSRPRPPGAGAWCLSAPP
jgi:integrase